MSDFDTEINLATAGQHELKTWAKKELDLDLTMSMKPETMRERIMKRCAEMGLEAPTASVGVAKKGEDRATWPRVSP